MGETYVCIMSLVLDRWGRRTGIGRVEYEIARELKRHGARMITFDYVRRRFVGIDFDTEIEPILRAQDCQLAHVLNGDPIPDGRRWPNLARRAAATAGAVVGGRLGSYLLAVASPALSPAERFHYAERLQLFSRTKRAIQYIDFSLRPNAGFLRSMLKNPIVEFRNGDVIIVPAIFWTAGPLRALLRAKTRSGVRIAPYIHDLIPHRRPDYSFDRLGILGFRRYIFSMLESSVCFFTNSDFVAGDLRALMRERGSPETPVHTVPLCPSISTDVPTELTSRLRDMRLRKGAFALYVSTLAPRKNHIGAIRLWRKLVRELGEACPALVFAGQLGRRYDEVLKEIADPVFGGKHIRLVEGLTDAELAYLYKTCGFTIFPSHYEGWGLSITESLEFGKPCIAADNTALREASQGLACHVRDFDSDEALALVRRLATNTAAREAESELIKSTFRRRTWSEVGSEIAGILSQLDSNKPCRDGAEPARFDQAPHPLAT